MGYDQANIVDEIMNIIDTIVGWGIKIISIIANFGIDLFNMVMQLF